MLPNKEPLDPSRISEAAQNLIAYIFHLKKSLLSFNFWERLHFPPNVLET